MVCYLERGPGGSTLRRIRLVGAAFDRSWSAPVAGEIGSGSGGSEGAAAVSAVRSGAKWVADTLKGLGTSRLDILCLDAQGGICTWLSAPSADPGIVSATIQQSVLSGGEGAGGAAGRLIATGIASSAEGGGGGLESDVSVQALAVAGEEPRKGFKLSLPGRTPDLGSARERFAVLAMRDAPVRVFLDELDSRGIEVISVESIWHALAATWDPGAPQQGEPASTRATLSAVILTDPAGRLVWAWSVAGELMAAGQVRLRHVIRRDDRPAIREAGPGGSAELAVSDATTARRVDDEVDEVSGLECTGAEVGRIVMDWLAWSAQLGRVPDRILCFGPITLPDPGNGAAQWMGGPTPATLAEGLGRAWVGSDGTGGGSHVQIDAAAHEDPIGATLARLAGVGPLGARPAGAPGADTDDPRRELLNLSSRPGRADKWMYRSMAVGFVAAALLVAAVGWQLHRAAGGGSEAIAAARKVRMDALVSMEPFYPNVSKNEDQGLGILAGKAAELEQMNKSLKAQRPILQEVARVLRAIDGAENTRIKEMTINAAAGSVRLVVPDNETGPAIFERLTATQGGIPWRGSTPQIGGEERLYVLVGTWPTEPATGGRP
mgnify:CR=1 FL=1